MRGPAKLDNQGNYKFQGDGDGPISTNYGGSVTNEASGTITKAAGTGTSTINTAMYNIGTPDMSGTLDVEAGTLMLKPQHLVGYNGTFTGGTFNVAAGATLDLTGGLTSSSYTGTYTGSAPARSRSRAAPWSSAGRCQVQVPDRHVPVERGHDRRRHR